MAKIQSLASTSIEELFIAFSKAFADYEIQMNKNELETMLSRRGYVPELSFGAFFDGRLVAFTLNGIGGFNGNQTAYDTGTATIKEYRGQGLASNIFKYSIPFLKKAGITHYLLEVLQHNNKAVSVYKKLGFKVTREFNYFVRKMDEITVGTKSLPIGCELQIIDLSMQKAMAKMWDFSPAWQNSFDSINRLSHNFKMIGVYNNLTLVGYGIFDPEAGDITQIAVDTNYRRKGIASVLLQKMAEMNSHNSIKLVNADVTCTSIVDFLNSKSIPVSGKQFEMVKEL